jgi:predicted nucleotidyltransferase
MTLMDLAAATDLLRDRVPSLRVAWLHGSRARGDARADSDVDLAFLAEADIRLDAFLALQADLAAILGAEVDLVDLFTADDVLRVQVIEHGRALFERTPSERARFEMNALSRYAHLNEERRWILEDVHRRGSVYG